MSPSDTSDGSLVQLMNTQSGGESARPLEIDSTSLPLPSHLERSISETATSENAFLPSLADFNFHQWSPDALFTSQTHSTQDDWYPSDSQITRGCELFFDHVAGFLPFLHRPTFNTHQTSKALLLSVLALAYQYGENPDSGDDVGSGQSLSVQCFYRARASIATEEEHVDESLHGVTLVQAYLLLEVFALIYSTDNDAAYGLKTHSKMICLARAVGLMQPESVPPPETEDLESLWLVFARAESAKRTLFAVHQIDTLWYQILSIPRSLSHLEIKHDLPCRETFFEASSSAEWAVKQLCNKNQNSTVPYPDAVRRLLSGDHLSAIPDFDPYGTINITHFILSSAREISGWSSMTGMLSMDRIEPLRAALQALGPYAHPETPNGTQTPSAALWEATWETAMIDMQSWSPSHTGGIIANSLDASLHQMTVMAPSFDLMCKSKIASTIQPHVDWFLRYLDATLVPDTEAPWVILYAYKAFMIAWQLLDGGAKGCMQVVGVQDGDREAALAWAKKAFGRRIQWKLGKVVVNCLDNLRV
ncbi:hypothetical protein DPSP01_010176 [Paraphaeosphaeria sporulosa]|uniref:Xylanolytic transcriptional activator regulatory domain-containing protein n=1 Tax=Paraphaeosphaeria sporulosa TaxID=1460663 RepID=A0A177D0K7_9PLEO|nr:uncharacterized protein CC84DRAFT_1212173 [Paraphaeosphaeria sporulosa]OAG12660.1 hypothetical protein CC84DRAFT_1212173 [Paraphaeosphaeria sporulosa]